MADDTIEVEFQLTADDLAEFCKQECGQFDCPEIKTLAGFTSFIIVVAAALAFGIQDVGFHPAIILVVGILIGSVFVSALFFPVSYFFNKRAQSAYKHLLELENGNFMLRSQKFRISPLRIRVTSRLDDSKLKWETIEKIKKADRYAYLYIASGMALIVPWHAFADEAAFERFYEKCLEYFNAAKGEPAQEAAG